MRKSMEDLNDEERALFLNALPLLSRAFWGPAGEWCAEILEAVRSGEMMAFGDIVGNQAAATALEDYLSGFQRPDDLCSALEPAYIRLFISDLGGVRAPLYHSFYESQKGRLMGRAAAMMSERLQNAGLSLPEGTSVPPDHLAVEAEYLILLLDDGIEQGERASLDAARAFAREEMQPWLSALIERLESETACPLYPSVARLLLAATTLASFQKE